MSRAAALILALCTTFAVAAPAHAADVKTIGCVEKTIKPAAKKLVLADLATNLDNAGGPQSYRPETVTAIQAVARACQAKYGWSDAATEASILYAMPRMGWPLAVAKAKAKRVSAAKLRARFNALPQTDRNDAVNERVLGILAQGSLAANEINADNAALAGALYGLLGLESSSLVKFRNN